MDTLRKQLADQQHAIWAHWMRDMFTCGSFSANGSWTMPAEKVERWQRQMDTPYSDLSEKERESDRHQADKVLGVLSAADQAAQWQDAIYKLVCKLSGSDAIDGAGCEGDELAVTLAEIEQAFAIVTDGCDEKFAAANKRAEAAEARVKDLERTLDRALNEVDVTRTMDRGRLAAARKVLFRE